MISHNKFKYQMNNNNKTIFHKLSFVLELLNIFIPNVFLPIITEYFNFIIIIIIFNKLKNCLFHLIVLDFTQIMLNFILT